MPALQVKIAGLRLAELAAPVAPARSLDIQPGCAPAVAEAAALVWSCLPSSARDVLIGVKVEGSNEQRSVGGIVARGLAKMHTRTIWICSAWPFASIVHTTAHELAHIYLKAIGSAHWSNENSVEEQVARWALFFD